MKRIKPYLFAVALIAGCATPKELRVQVTPLGDEPDQVQEQYLYVLPQTVLKIEVVYEEISSVPGPYWEYAERYLGIAEIIKQKSSHWQIHDVVITPHLEVDPSYFYSINVLEGESNGDCLSPFLEKGIVMDGTELIQEEIRGTGLQSIRGSDILRYVDLGVDSNFEERTETMYKTLVTDTSFVKVPVQRTVVEQKSFAMKAKEAADFLLEVRTRRFEMLTGEYEVYPDGEAMAAAIHKLDQMEESYLSLFIGKTTSRMEQRAYFIVPESGSKPSQYPLGMFSDQLGFVPDELMEGAALVVQIVPMGNTNIPGINFSGSGVSDPYNKIYYRLPDMADLNVLLGNELLSKQRISIFQSGAVITSSIHAQ